MYSPHIITTYTGATTTHPPINPQDILLCTQVPCLCPHTGTSLSRKGIHYINAILKKIAMQLPPGESLVHLTPPLRDCFLPHSHFTALISSSGYEVMKV